MKSSIVIVLFFVLGVVLARFDLLHELFYIEHLSKYILFVLIFSVGISIGSDTSITKTIKNYGAKIFLAPLATIIGTLLGCLVLGIIWDARTIGECMAVGSGFGYYSLSSILITDIKGEELGIIALVSNIIREIFTLLFAPFIVSLFGKLALVSSGGATTMDTTLPIITRFSGQDFVVIAIFHGIVVDFSVPFLVTFFASL